MIRDPIDMPHLIRCEELLVAAVVQEYSSDVQHSQAVSDWEVLIQLLL